MISELNHRVPRLFDALAVARGDGRHPRMMKAIERTDLLILDDWSLAVLTSPERRDLLEILEDRHGRGSTIVTTQLPVEHWHETIGEPAGTVGPRAEIHLTPPPDPSPSRDRCHPGPGALTCEKPMTQHDPETVLDGSPSDARGRSVLHERDFLRLAPALDLSTGEWLRVFQAHCEPPSSRREAFWEPLEQQLMFLPWDVHDDDPCPESLELAKRIDALPRVLKLTVLDAIERFWSDGAVASSWDERLRNLGLRPCDSAHARLAALEHRRHALPEIVIDRSADQAAGRTRPGEAATG